MKKESKKKRKGVKGIFGNRVKEEKESLNLMRESTSTFIFGVMFPFPILKRGSKYIKGT